MRRNEEFFVILCYNIRKRIHDVKHQKKEVMYMDIKSFEDMKTDLKEFEKEKDQIIRKFNDELNNPENKDEALNRSMAAIYYEYARITTMPKMRQCEPNPRCKTEEGRIAMLLNYIKGNFNREQIIDIANNLGLLRADGIDTDVQSVRNAIPKIKELAEPVLTRVETLKKDVQECYLSHCTDFKHISSVDITDGKVNPSFNLENQPQNQILTGVFATSSYEGMISYMGRAITGGMVVNNRGIRFPKSPFAPMQEQDDSQKAKLAKPVYAYSLDADGFEPQMHFSKKGDAYLIEFNNEWVKSTEQGLKINAKEELQEVDCQPFLERNTTYVDVENGRIRSFTEEFAEKFGIDLNRKENEHGAQYEH